MNMNIEEYMLSCPTKKYWRIDCMGCGMQRSIVMVFQGRFQEAFELFPAVYPFLFLILFAVLSFIDKKRNYHPLMITMGILTGVIMVGSYFYRNFF